MVDTPNELYLSGILGCLKQVYFAKYPDIHIGSKLKMHLALRGLSHNVIIKKKAQLTSITLGQYSSQYLYSYFLQQFPDEIETLRPHERTPGIQEDALMDFVVYLANLSGLVSCPCTFTLTKNFHHCLIGFLARFFLYI